MKITESEKQRIQDGDAASVCVSPEYFSEGDYTEWQDQDEETEEMSYSEYADWLVQYMKEKYDHIDVHSDGCVYGNRGGISHDISYNDFDDVETFIELAEKYGIAGTLQFY